VSGAGVPSVGSVETFFQRGPQPITGATTLGSPDAVSGKVTSIAVDPNDPTTIYLTAASGGAWKTVNSGKTWTPMFDIGIGNMFTGAIAVAPSNSNVLYLGTGEADSAFDSYAGSGVYMSTDAGHSWTLLTSQNGSNPIAGLAVSKIAVDNAIPSIVYVATSDLASPGSVVRGNDSQPAGVFRYDGANWF